jgi:hypothetical protein
MSLNNGNGNTVKWSVLYVIVPILVVVATVSVSTGVLIGKINALKDQTDWNTAALNKQGEAIGNLQTAVALTGRSIDDINAVVSDKPKPFHGK